MKRFFLILTAIVSMAFIVSCNKENDDFLSGIEKLSSLTIEQFKALGSSNEYYAIQGTIKSISDRHYSQFEIEDNSGSVSIYGLWDCEEGDRIMDMGSYNVGDRISLAAKPFTFKGVVEAKKSFPYDPSNISIYSSKLSASFTSDGGEQSLSVYAKSKVDVEIAQEWLTAEYVAANQTLKITTQQNNNNKSRSAKIKLSCNGCVLKITVIQEAKTSPKVSIIEALDSDFATVEGVVSVVLEDGVILSDATASIYVKSDEAAGYDQGVKLEVSGDIYTQDYITGIIANNVVSYGKAVSELSAPKVCTLTDIQQMQKDFASANSNKHNYNSLKYVAVSGVLNPGDGAYYIEDFDQQVKMVNLRNTDGFTLDPLRLVLVTVQGFVAEYAENTITIIPLEIEKKIMDSAIAIDGDCSDWTSISGYAQADTNNIYELKLYTIGTDIYMYAKMRSDAFTEFGTMKYFIQIYFNTDNDNTTGPAAWVFKGLDSSGYVRMTNGTDGFWRGTNGDGSNFVDFIFNNPDATFVSANKTKFDGDFTAYNDSYPCGGTIHGEVAEFEWVFSMGLLKIPRHTSIGVGVRLVHEGSDNPYRAQANYLIPTSGWWSYSIE